MHDTTILTCQVSRGGGLNSRPNLYERLALPLSYPGTLSVPIVPLSGTATLHVTILPDVQEQAEQIGGKAEFPKGCFDDFGDSRGVGAGGNVWRAGFGKAGSICR